MSENTISDKTKNDTIISILLDMGYTFESIQAYISYCHVNNLEPSVSNAVTFIEHYTDSNTSVNVNTQITNTQMTTQDACLFRQIESTIPTVLSSSGKTNIPKSNETDSFPVISSRTKHPSANSNSSQHGNYDYKKSKIAKKQLREEVLSQINYDKRERYSSPRHSTQTNNNDNNNNNNNNNNDNNNFNYNNYDSNNNNNFRISIRLLDGSRVICPALETDTLNTILDWITINHYDTTGCSLIQSFPFRKFTPEEHNLKMSEIGINRFENLTLHKMEIDEKSIFGQSNHSPQTQNANLPTNQNLMPVLGNQIPLPGNPFLPNQGLLLPPQHDWGTQASISGGEHVRKKDVIKRFENVKICKKIQKFYNTISTLQELILKLLMRCAKQKYLPKFKKINPTVCSIVLQRLIKEQLLSPKIAESFINCHLHTIDLTSCQHVTNDLLSRLVYIRNPKTLIIKGSPYLTDKGVKYIGGMTSLESLYLENCEKLSDTCISYLSALNSLKCVSFRNTKIMENGLNMLLQVTSKNHMNTLLTLDLGRTKVSNALSQCIMAKCDNLEKLRLDGVDIKEMFPSKFALTDCLLNLKELDLSGCTFKNNENFWCLTLMPKLTTLKLYDSDIHDFSFLENLNLSKISFPRTVVNLDNSTPFRYLKCFQLTELDLTNCISVTEDSLKHIAEISHLNRLILRNVRTPIASSFQHLSSLICLTFLDLEHTSIDDITTIFLLNYLKSLTHLNLTGTKVTDQLLESRILNSIIYLEYLNLNHNDITSTGLGYLSLPYLGTLLVNSIELSDTERCNVIQNCPSIAKL